jgi:hypothetical protein
MNSPPSTPPNRRRRKIIVAFALVLVSLVSWWYWPRGDARFVGAWKLSGDPNGHWQFNANEVAIWVPERGPYATLYTKWRATNDILEIGLDERLSRPSWLNWAILQWNLRFPKHQWLDSGLVVRLLSIEPRTLETVEVHYNHAKRSFVDREPKAPITFTRIPE